MSALTTELAGDHASNVTQSRCVAGNPRDTDHSVNDIQGEAVGVHLAPPTRVCPTPMAVSSAGAVLGLAAANLDDVERTRMAVASRVGAMDRDGGGHLPEVARMRALLDVLSEQEHQCVLTLKRALRLHPLGPWVKATVGVGEKQGARLIAALGSMPDWNDLEDRARRGPAELWAYCGLHTLPADHVSIDTHVGHVGGQNNVAARRRKGQRANWSTVAKTRAYLIAESCIKQSHSPYRPIYDRERAKWEHRDTTPLHQHNHALRVVSKEVLKDLWRESRRLRLEGMA